MILGFSVAELRRWVKTGADRDSFQGYVFNDDSHTNRDGTFVTIEADETIECSEGLIVYCRKRIYYLWNNFKRSSE